MVDLKEVAYEQKIKIGCLRKHRDAIRDELVKLEEVHDAKMKHNDEMVTELNEEVAILKKQNADYKDPKSN